MNTSKKVTLSVALLGLIFFVSLASDIAAQDKQPPKRLNEFDLSYSLIPVEHVLRGGPPRDGIPSLTHPEVLEGHKAESMKPDDLVIGVAINGEARAYPLRIMSWHEIVNDTLGGEPVLVTYCPLCRSTLVFERKIAGEVREFGVSGLLYNSNVLMYSKALTLDQSSLWSQGQLRAVIGPDAEKGRKLTLMQSVLTTWNHWLKNHPNTTVLSENTGHSRNYSQEPYEDYFLHEKLKFPVFDTDLEDRPERFKIKEPMILVQADESWKAYSVNDVAQATGSNGWFTDTLGDFILLISYDPESKTVNIGPQGNQPAHFAMTYLYWFAIKALKPDVEIYYLNQQPWLSRSAATCDDYLTLIFWAKEKWADDKNKMFGDVPTWEDLLGPTYPYLWHKLVCPNEGVYELNGVGEEPTCSCGGGH